MVYLLSKEPIPENWDGVYLLECRHHYNSKAYDDFLMYCNILKEMPNDRLKIKVFGYRWTKTSGEKIRYVARFRVVKARNFKVFNEQGKL